MRTTIDLEEDILRVAKSLARERGQSLGLVVSDLARRGLGDTARPPKIRNGVPILPRKAGAKRVTSDDVKELLESEN